MFQKIVTYLTLIASFLGVFLSLALIFKSTEPCSGDGCMIHLLLLIGLPMLLLSGGFFYISFKKIKDQFNPFL